MEKDRVRKAIQELKQFYKGLSFEPLIWQRDGNKRDAYRTLIVMGLSQQTSDKKGLPVWGTFLSLYPTANDLIKAWNLSRDKVLSIVEPLGLHGRSHQILEAAVDFGIAIPSEAADLQRPGRGIGETTAEKIVGYGYGKPALPLDSHGCRVVSRICNLSPSQHHRCLRKQLKHIFRRRSDWIEVHELLRLHGQVVCKKSQPACGNCPLSVCASRGDFDQDKHAISPRKAAKEVVALWDKWRQLLIS